MQWAERNWEKENNYEKDIGGTEIWLQASIVNRRGNKMEPQNQESMNIHTPNCQHCHFLVLVSCAPQLLQHHHCDNPIAGVVFVFCFFVFWEGYI